MSQDQAILDLLGALVAQTSRIATALEIIVSAQVPAPNYKRQLTEYKSFDWENIGAQVVASDAHGPTKVEWNGRVFTRRNSDDKKKGQAVWYSAVISGTVADGNCKWGRLVSFKNSTSEPEPLAEKIASETGRGAVSAPATPAPKPAPQVAPPAPTIPTSPTPAPAMVTPPAAAITPSRPASELDAHFGPNPRQTAKPASTPLTDSAVARAKFYAMSGEAIKNGKISHMDVNALVKAANGGGFAKALKMLEEKLKG